MSDLQPIAQSSEAPTIRVTNAQELLEALETTSGGETILLES